jgi:hypothetical protein
LDPYENLKHLEYVRVSDTMAEPIVDNNPNPSGGVDYKAKLDEAASRVKSPPQENQGNGIIDKGVYSLSPNLAVHSAFR